MLVVGDTPDAVELLLRKLLQLVAAMDELQLLAAASWLLSPDKIQSAVVGANPDVALLVFVNIIDVRMAQRIGLLLVGQTVADTLAVSPDNVEALSFR